MRSWYASKTSSKSTSSRVWTLSTTRDCPTAIQQPPPSLQRTGAGSGCSRLLPLAALVYHAAGAFSAVRPACAPKLHRDFILTTLDSAEIQRLIPHRYPFLLIDRV